MAVYSWGLKVDVRKNKVFDALDNANVKINLFTWFGH